MVYFLENFDIDMEIVEDMGVNDLLVIYVEIIIEMR